MDMRYLGEDVSTFVAVLLGINRDLTYMSMYDSLMYASTYTPIPMLCYFCSHPNS